MASVHNIVILCMFISTIGIVKGGNFSHSCHDINFHGNIMYAICSKYGGEKVHTSIDVNDCVGSTGGRLDCSGNFVYSCDHVEFNGITMRATCRKDYYTTVVSNRALDTCIQNIEGQLQCCD